jgi:hypothetical protein
MIYGVYRSSIVWLLKSKRLQWAVHGGRIGPRRNTCRILVAKELGASAFEDGKFVRRVILRWIWGM